MGVRKGLFDSEVVMWCVDRGIMVQSGVQHETSGTNLPILIEKSRF